MEQWWYMKDVAVIMGGPSSEHEVSLQSGAKVVEALALFDASVRPIVVTREGAWTVDGRAVGPENALNGVSAALLATHGEWGEDGRLQMLLERFRVPYSGSGVDASAVSFDKALSRDVFSSHGLVVPRGMNIGRKNRLSGADKKNIIETVPGDSWVVKPARAGSSVGVTIVASVEQIPDALNTAWKFCDNALIEERVKGTEVTCGILEQFPSRAPIALPLTQIIPSASHDFFDYTAKYSGDTSEVTPAPLDETISELIKTVALTAHRAVGARHYSRTDMIIKDGMPYVLELNTLPGLTEQSLLPKQASAWGMPFPKLIEHILELVMDDAKIKS